MVIFFDLIHSVVVHFPVCFQSKIPNDAVTAMESDSSNSLLFTGDNHGFVSVWNIENYCIDGFREESSPDCTYWNVLTLV